MRARGNPSCRRELLGAVALLLVLALWCPRTEGQGGGGKRATAHDLAILRGIFSADQYVNIRLKNVPPGQFAGVNAVKIVDVVEVFGTRFLRVTRGGGDTTLVRADQILAIEGKE